MPIPLQKAITKPNSRLILASSSPRRKDLLGGLIKEFDVVSADVSEWINHPDGPESLVLKNAKLKSFQVADSFPCDWVIGADTLVTLRGETFGKPADLNEAKSMLTRLSGKTHQVLTGICLVNRALDISRSESICTDVSFQKLDRLMIDNYFERVDPLDKAGAYAIQTCPEMIVNSYEGSLSNVIGLPIELLREWFEEYQIS